MCLSGLMLTLAASASPAAIPTITITTGTGPAGGYLPLSSFGVAPIAGVGDDTLTDFTTPAFMFAGESWTHLRVSSNGYLVVGPGNGAADNNPFNTSLPALGFPTNVLAPFWTDLDPSVGGGVRIALLSNAIDSWIVTDWEGVPQYGSVNTDSFQVWLQTGATEGITFSYGWLDSVANGHLTIGADDSTGTVGATYYFDGTGTLPASGSELRVTSEGLPASPVPLPAAASAGMALLAGLGAVRFLRRRHPRAT